MLSFEELREVHRKERSSPSILSLEAGFWNEVAGYIHNKMEKYEELSGGKSRFTNKVLAKFERELRNAARVIVELYALRERKILMLAWSEVATDEKTDTRPLTPEERKFFSSMVSVMKSVRTEVLDKTLAGEKSKVKAEKKEKEPDKVKAEILEDVQAFMGTDLNLYGPYSKGDNVELPKKYAKLLMDKGKAKQHKP